MKIKDFKARHQGQECLILGCGPSLGDFNPYDLTKLAEGKVIFSIKQAYSYASLIADYHFLNSANIDSYQYYKPIPIILELASNELSWGERIPHHILVNVKNNTDFSQSLTMTHDFDKWSFHNSKSRPWGPGLLYETIFFYGGIHGFF